ncbi:MAG: chemotaxis protein CheV [Synergistaceae bacterium]|nr:chemotaxis protein CheV [Synergistaceae bacterium]MBQ4418980.1 chemotaxis protein CheV [Synergistaceae bacterium]MBQ7569508.1 chemotaxis protein CheV [Synergistaceae bacterium]MBQ9582649.1 chemotaxis protein CheV [Synergistaceae bacterium]MBQ9897748.1 chemotaxis protein CheV [Synergistaceae bacterium]
MEIRTGIDRDKERTASGAKKWDVVIFTLGDEAYGINVDRIREILSWRGCRPIPTKIPSFIGITSIRGVLHPLIDLRVFLGTKDPLPLEQSKIMIVEFNNSKLGFLVDKVERIRQVNSDELDASKMRGVSLKWILYVLRKDERNILFLDYEAIIQEIAPQVEESMNAKNNQNNNYEQLGNVEDFHILVADDSKLLRQQICDAIKETGFSSVYPVKDGAEAKELLLDKKENFDLLVTDVEMPLMDGVTLSETLRADKHTENMPIILFSSLMIKRMLDHLEELNVHHVLKPDIHALIDMIVALYREKRRGKGQKV